MRAFTLITHTCVSMALGALIGAGACLVYAQAPPDPCRLVRDELSKYAAIVANQSVRLQELQAQQTAPAGEKK